MSPSHFTALFEVVALKGSYTMGAFQRLVAARYTLAPVSEPAAIPLYKLLVAKVQRQAQMLGSKYAMQPTMGDPYPSMKAMTKDINQQKAAGVKPVVPVYAVPPKDIDNAPITNDQNVQLRWVHDLIAHYFGQHPFSGRGEYAAYNRHLKTLPPAVAPILFTEIVGQTSVYKVYGDYTAQKAVILRDFNFFRVGELAPESPLNHFFVLDRKALAPIQGFQWAAFEQAHPDLAGELARQPKFNPQEWENYNREADTSLLHPKQMR